MIALSTYKIANYLVDIVQFSHPDIPVSRIDVYNLRFGKQDPSRNNCFFSFDKTGKHNYFFKQSKAFTDSNIQDARSEAELYHLFKRHSVPKLKETLPRLVFFDNYNSVIVTEYFPNFQKLGSQPLFFYKKAGEQLKHFHSSYTLAAIAGLRPRFKWIDDFRRYQPIILRMTEAEKNALTRKANPYFSQLVAYLKTNKEEVAKWRQEWEFETQGLIHGDAKVDNFGSNGLQLQIIDFEYSSYGAWLWDVAGFIMSLLVITNIPTTSPPRSGLPADDIYPQIQKFCEGYEINTPELQQKVLRWTGIYFLQFFLQSETPFHLQHGLDLITKNAECHQKIFA
ncbi:phosphotransferase [Runella slithyformis]|uniref:Aminoglycoside phosphotransferase n=1 Tax=Runella slithyformis (strain ATCC 29530 / DSM 19594 / LMG 11500 / NCIMB 11436 / LSU 4) TaxID=761193 RepID=A0A7U3ZM87_RUNSL|nr:phosphotransferase [Runella slithyformis]AEI49792.1 aminoglycoside phosphotransferase [Runella slithyformis DSM 19594]